jgi:hypothetical protein
MGLQLHLLNSKEWDRSRSEVVDLIIPTPDSEDIILVLARLGLFFCLVLM